MHNCKEIREQLIELLLDGDGHAEGLLDQCEECRTEFDAVAATLRTTARLRETVTPSAGYHSRLRERLMNASEVSHAKAQRRKEEPKPSVFASSFAPLRLCAKFFFLPVPVPLGLAVLAAGLVSALFVLRATRQPIPPAPVVVQVPVEVPVVQEKIVTQVVYRDRWHVSKPATRVVDGPPTDSALARSRTTLSGFKPTDEVKLTVIKGGSPNEK